jgi:hypothetical protein
MIAIMAERKTTMNLFGKEQAVTEVPIVNAKETAAEYELEDGSVLRVRYVANSVLRIDGVWEGDGNPVYLIKNGLVTTVLKAGEVAKKPLF